MPEIPIFKYLTYLIFVQFATPIRQNPQILPNNSTKNGDFLSLFCQYCAVTTTGLGRKVAVIAAWYGNLLETE